MTSNYTFPGTSVQAEIIQPSTPTTDLVPSYVPLFLKPGQVSTGTVASINAGTSNYNQEFEVGLGGINGAFNKVLVSHANQDTGRYKKIHQELFDSAQSNGSFFSTQYTLSDPVSFAYLTRPLTNDIFQTIDGTVIMDVFNSTQRPYGIAENYMMIYVLPPMGRRYQSLHDFKSAVEKTAVIIIDAIQHYNSELALQHQLHKIDELRMCLYSGSIYRHHQATVDDVAVSNFNGLSKQLKKFGDSNTLKKVLFENSGVAENGKYVASFKALDNIINTSL